MAGRATTPTTPIERHVADILREAFQRSRFHAQADLGAAVDRSQSQVSSWLSGAKAMRLGEFLAVCQALSLDPSRVMTEAEERVAAAIEADARAALSPEEWAAIEAERPAGVARDERLG